MSLEQFTSPDQMAPFYGQSLTLVAMLTEKQPTSVLMTFALEAKSVGLCRSSSETLWNRRAEIT